MRGDGCECRKFSVEMHAAQMRQDSLSLCACKDDGDMLRLLGAFDLVNVRQIYLEHLTIEKQESRGRYLLSRCRHMAFHCQVRQIGANLHNAHIFGVAFVVKENELANIIEIGLFRLEAIMFEAQNLAHLIEQARRLM